MIPEAVCNYVSHSLRAPVVIFRELLHVLAKTLADEVDDYLCDRSAATVLKEVPGGAVP
jgi:hypothetical protein